MALRINTGGALSPKEVIGRDALIARIWQTLEQHSIQLHAERRMGKTSIIKKMAAEPQHNFIPIYRDLENVNTPERFLQCVLDDVNPWLTNKQKTKEGFKVLWKTIGGTELGGKIKLPAAKENEWKAALETLLQEIRTDAISRIVFLWDEMPLMIHNIKRDRGESQAMEMLDTLRAIRHAPKTQSLRMVFTGSIGLHHVLTELRNAGHANKPVNDMANIVVPSLEPAYAYQLAAGLLEGIGVTEPQRKEAAEAIAEITDGIPFYIHHFVQRVRDHSGGIPKALTNINRLKSELLFDPQDSLDLKYYRERIHTYYPEALKSVATDVLDALVNKEPLQFSKLSACIKLKAPNTEEEALRETLSLLERDHYLQRDEEGYRFQRQFVREGWKALRGIQ